jgi:hypothetical protein
MRPGREQNKTKSVWIWIQSDPHGADTLTPHIQGWHSGMAEQNLNIRMNWTPKGAQGSDPKRYMALPFRAHPIDHNHALLLTAGDHLSRRLPVPLVRLLGCCDRLRSIDDHARLASERLAATGVRGEELKGALMQLIEQGLLKSESQLAASLGPTGGVTEQDMIQMLFVRTCSRGEVLRRLLESLSRQPADSLPTRCLILDDSRDEADRGRNQKIVDAFRDSLPMTIELIDRERRTALLTHIARAAGCRGESLHWLIEGAREDDAPSYGAGPNLALLLAAGQRFWVLDDDATLDAWAPPGAKNRLLFSPGAPERVWLPDATGTMPPPGHQKPETHPLRLHSDYLGLEAADLLSNAKDGGGGMFDELTPGLFHQLLSRPTVKLTCSGAAGDPGTEDVQWIFTMPPADLRDLDAPEAEQRDRIFGRCMVRASDRAVASPAFALMTTTLTGIDNRELLLPTAAKARNEDLLLGALVGYLYPNSLHMTLPHALHHMRPAPRRWTEEDLDRPKRPGQSSMLAAWLEEFGDTVRTRETAGRVASLIAGMKDLARQEPESLRVELAETMAQRRSHMIRRVQHTRAGLEPPEWLHQHFQRVISAIADIPDDESAHLERAADSIRRFSEAYAQSLPDWCLAWEHCRERGIERLLDDADA